MADAPPVNRVLKPRQFGTAPVAAPVGLTGTIANPRPAVDNLAEGLTAFNKGLTEFLGKRKEAQDERDVAQAYDDVQQGRVTRPDGVDQSQSQKYIETIYGALGEKGGYEAIQELDGLVTTRGHEPNFNYDDERRRILAERLQGTTDPNILRSFYKVFQERSETIERGYLDSITKRTKEESAALFRSNHFTSMSSALRSSEPAHAIAYAGRVDREWLSKARAAGLTSTEINDTRIEAVKVLALRSKNPAFFDVFTAPDPSGAPLTSHPDAGPKIRKALDSVLTALKTNDSHEKSMLQAHRYAALEDALEQTGDFPGGVTVTDLDNMGFRGDLSGPQVVRLKQLQYEAVSKKNQTQADLNSLLGADGALPFGQAPLVNPHGYEPSTPDERLQNAVTEMRARVLAVGKTEAEADQAEATLYHTAGYVTDAAKHEINTSLMSGDPATMLESYRKFNKLYINTDNPHLASKILDSAARRRKETLDYLTQEFDTETVMSVLQNMKDPERMDAVTRSLTTRAANEVILSTLESAGLSPSTPGYEKHVERLRRLAGAQMLATGVDVEAALAARSSSYTKNLVTLTVGDSDKVYHKSDVPPFMMSPTAGLLFETAANRYLKARGVDTGVQVVIPQTVKNMKWLGLMPLIVSQFHDGNPEHFFADIEPDELSWEPQEDGKTLLMIYKGAAIGSANWDKIITSLPKEMRDELHLEHEASLRAVRQQQSRRTSHQPSPVEWDGQKVLVPGTMEWAVAQQRGTEEVPTPESQLPPATEDASPALRSVAPVGERAEPAPAKVEKQPRGLRNNNPGNLRHSDDSWQGMTEGDDTDFVSFDSPENGVRAAAITLKNYSTLYGLNTIEGIISRWAPPSDNNPTQKYIETVAKMVGVHPTAKLDTKDPAVLSRLLDAIFKFENGGKSVPPEVLAEGISRS